MQDLSFQNLFDSKCQLIETKEETINIQNYSIGKVPSKISFPNFELVEGLKYTAVTPTRIIEKQVINITNNSYQISVKSTTPYFYRFTTINFGNKKYNFFSTKENYKNLYFTQFSSVLEVSKNKNMSCIDLIIDKDFLYVQNLKYPKNYGINGLDECFEIIFKIANICGIRKIKIIDKSHFDCGNEPEIYLSHFRILNKKSLSIYSKYGFVFEEEPFDDRDYKILNNFNIRDLCEEITLIIDNLELKNFNCSLENRNVNCQEFILKTSIFDFLKIKDQIVYNFISEKLDIDNCLSISKILNLIDLIGKYVIKIDNFVINKICIDINSVFKKLEKEDPYQVLYL